MGSSDSASSTGRPSLVCFGADIDQLRDAAVAAEKAGFESVWAAEFYDRSATIALAAMATATSTIELGSGIAYGFGRTPLVLAAEARDLDALSRGRLLLGLGTGTTRMQQDWHGLDGLHPAARIEELVGLLRNLWRLHEGPIAHDGRFYRLHVQPTAAVSAPLRTDIPIYLAGVNRRMVQAAGAVADGLVGHPLYTRDYVEQVVRPMLAEGAARTGRRPDVPIAGYLICSVDLDEERARARAAAQIAFYSTVKTYNPILELGGFMREAEAIRAAWKEGSKDAMLAAVSDPMIDAMAVAGTPEQVRRQVEQRWAGVYDRTLLYPPTFGGEPDLRLLIDSFAQ
ncbi:MAG: LLM class flavin-dependent oxidoreductase [Mycobacterium sp.]|nr:LLM class flavin-dependent oxidoreductase [Mycobacterium intracellulare]MDZ4265687.1 LLM class flavin-dependent oxidoreductase [Mycobacterium sp.]MEE3066680.1 LLM class flavin-dependent oxidoreductase [Actinomycetota bacterium]GAY17587.1 Luciferase-like protein [Mycobacterium sp. shizuoka-1]